MLAGLTPAAASASVHVSEIGTNLASGFSHWRLRNVDWRVVGRIAVPGAIGAFLGATVLSSLSTEAAAPVMSGILAALGVYILVRFILGIRPRLRRALTVKVLAPLGLFAGFIDASGGGGWGPMATPALLADGRMEPRKVIGSIDTAEFAVSASASLGFLLGLGAAGINWWFAVALLAGGRHRGAARGLPGPGRTRPPARGRGRRADPADQLPDTAEGVRGVDSGPVCGVRGRRAGQCGRALYLASQRARRQAADRLSAEQPVG